MTAPPGPGNSVAALRAPDVQGAFKGRTMGTAVVGTVLVVAHNSLPPAQDEWEHYCALIDAFQHTGTAQLVLAEGPGPSASQRQQALNKVPKGFAIPPTAVFTRSALVRGVVTLFNWFTPRAMRAFPPGDVAAAAVHLKMTEAQLQHVLGVASALLPPEP
ncbi:STAS/SEC14 domain-containing protein [Corallococcus praedator]|uniref:STAS/SEC14 domain-containing protein n=1 Tax=Corallococcus praedator TaxID=2316724 RepID=A0ABX9QK77_9BACT|nr:MULTISPECIES: STAS/SEC14 domain-containing protein [Corallococcus]RKH33579.1 STAS/SEC14 domain-containing protein [Corallococcus sp. CA031C]RKI11068.1 STAS/SEC14 domain-containing protein [Corallococcus praedator]